MLLSFLAARPIVRAAADDVIDRYGPRPRGITSLLSAGWSPAAPTLDGAIPLHSTSSRDPAHDRIPPWAWSGSRYRRRRRSLTRPADRAQLLMLSTMPRWWPPTGRCWWWLRCFTQVRSCFNDRGRSWTAVSGA